MKNIISIIFLFLFFLSVIFQAGIASSSGCVNINTAPKEELKKIIHIGESRAEQIISLRKEKIFSSIDDLDRMIGIGPSRIADIKKQGLACTGESRPEPKLKPEPGPLAFESEPKSLEPADKASSLIEKLAGTESQEVEKSHTLKSRGNVFAWWTAGLMALFSGAAILMLKKRLKIEYNKNI